MNLVIDNENKIIEQTDKYSANNYKPLPVVIEKGEGVWVYDVNGVKYLDMVSAYSAVNQGHRHPKIVKSAVEQLDRLTLTSRAFHNDKMGKFLEKACKLSGFNKAIPMNTGAEAVETAIKLARKWGYEKKGVENDKAEIVVCNNNFHGRTISIISFSTTEQYKDKFGPHTPGFVSVPFGDERAIENAINKNTVGVLIEPIQGEGGVNIPAEGYLSKVREITSQNNVLLMLDEIQTGLGRTGKMFCYLHENIKPDVLILGKALGGGVYPVSMVLADNNIMDVFVPGDHGSTFGGNPLGAVIGMASLDVLIDENLADKAKELGEYFVHKIRGINSMKVKEIRGKGLLIAVEIKKEYGKARAYCEELMRLGVLGKDTCGQVIRFAPPLVITKDEIDWAIEKIKSVLT